jgi:hypothetical protein
MASSSEIIILTNPEDWELWIAQVQAFTDEDIWEHIDPDDTQVEEDPLEKPKAPKVKDLDPNANSYTQLSTALQKTYDNSRKYYEQDLKQYQRQKDQFQAV